MRRILKFLAVAVLLPCLQNRAHAATAASAKVTAATSGETDDEEEDDDDEEEAGPVAKASKNEVKANIAFVSDYLDRGLTLSDHKPALQGGLDYEHKSGLFLGAWASSVSIPDLNASLELDVSGGYGFSFWHDIEQSFSVHYETYFAAEKRANWTLSEESKWTDFSLAFGFSPNYRENGYSWTATAGWTHEVKWGIQLGVFADYTVFAYKALHTTAVETTVNADGEEVVQNITVSEPTPNYADVRASVGHEFLGALWKVEGVWLKRQTIEGILAVPKAAVSVSREF